LELGADDYLPKPFSPRVVVARVRALLRRAGLAPSASQRIQIADLDIDLDAHQVTRAGQPVELTPTEFNLLVALASQPGRAFNRSQLLDAAQGTDWASTVGYERLIDAHIKNLRAKLEGNPRRPRYIETVFGVGYRFAKSQPVG
jgi:DNA-binding response OmpR family regulator